MSNLAQKERAEQENQEAHQKKMAEMRDKSEKALSEVKSQVADLQAQAEKAQESKEALMCYVKELEEARDSLSQEITRLTAEMEL